MNEKIKNEAPDVALELDKLNQVSGGTGKLEELVTRIKADGHAKELRDLLKTQGKPAAAAKCCEYYPELAGAAVTML